MNFLLDDLVNDLVDKVQKQVVPALEQVTHQAKEKLRRPPPGDLLYLTDRLIVSSAPAVAWPTPSYTDQGREDRQLWRDQEELLDESPAREESNSITTTTTTPVTTTENPQDGTASLTVAKSCSRDEIMTEPLDSQQEQTPLGEPRSALSVDTDSPSKGTPPSISKWKTNGEMVTDSEETTDSTVKPGNKELDGMTTNGGSDSIPSPIATEVPVPDDAMTVDPSFHTIPATNSVDGQELGASIQKTDDNALDGVPTNGGALKARPLTGSEVPVPVEPVSVDHSLATRSTTNHVDGQESGGLPASPSEVLGSLSHPPDVVIAGNDKVKQTSTNILSTPNKEEKDNVTSMVEDSAVEGSQEERDHLSTPVARQKSEVSPAASPNPSVKERVGESSSSDDTTMAESSADVDENDAPIEGGKPPNIYQHPPNSGSSLGTSPATIVSFLEKRHGRNHFLAFALTDERPDDRNLLLFRRQIVQLGWSSPCPERSETPSIPHILQICYAIHAYLYLDPSNVALVYCANGKTRTAIVMACYLKFVGMVATAKEAFLKFLAKRGIPDPTKTWDHLPPSLHLFFQQFDSALHLGGFLNRKPLLLRAIALQGIPVEDKPCLDIWDSSQRHVYSSHPEIMGQEGLVNLPNLSQWADEEGFYRVNVVLEGEFLLLCRFGGDFAEDITIHDPSKILFRYTNTTGFLSGGYPYELTPDRVDLYRRYASHLDDEDFLVTLLFEANWESSSRVEEDNQALSKSVCEQLRTTSSVTSHRIFRCQEPDAVEEGVRVLVQHHSARPNRSDIEDFQKLYQAQQIDACEDHLICIALQLSNFDMQRAFTLLVESPSFSWWKGKQKSHLTATEEVPGFKWKRVKAKQSPAKRYGTTAVATKEILSLLDEVMVESNLDEPDRWQLQKISAGTKSTPGQRTPLNQSTIDSQILKSGWMVPSLMYPRKGDIVGSYSDHYRQFHRFSSNNHVTTSVTATNLPRIPFFPHNKPALIPPPLAKRQRREDPTPIHFIPHNKHSENVVQFHDNINHSNVALSDLIQLIDVSQTWADKPLVSDDEMSDDEQETDSDPERAVTTREPTGSMNREAKEQKEQKWEEAKKAEAREKEKQKAEAARKKEEDEAKRKEGEQESSPPSTNDGEVPLKDDPEYTKYFKMLKMGMPKEQVLHAMTRDEKDHTVLDLDPNKSLKAQRPPEQGDIPLNQDPEYEKYFKMLKMGLPIGAVKNALTRDGKDPSIMDLDPNKSLRSQMPTNQEGGGADDGIPLKDDPEYTKYFKMLKMGLPVDAVKNALTRDGKDPGIMDLDPEKSLKLQMSGSRGDDGPALKDDPEFAKYFKMLSMGLPIGAVKNALARDGKDPAIMDLDPNKSVKSQLGGDRNDVADSGPPLKDDPEYAKYFKMLSMGLPLGAVKNALSRDGKDPSIMDLDPNKSVSSQLGGALEKDTGVPLKDDPEYSKYFKMLGMGLPMGAVKNALERDGKNPSVMDMDPNKSVAFQMKKGPGGKQLPVKKKKRVRRKKIYWNPIDPSKLKEDSMWNIVRGAIAMEKLNYDEKEFEDLFTESADPADQKNNKKETKKEEKKLVQVIDPKRSMNGGIVLARLKTDHAKIAEFVNRMDHGKFDATQLKALKEYLPDDEERRGLITYMKKGEASPDIRAKLYADCSETEKYMVSMIEVQDAGAKLDAMLFRTIFKNRFEETTEAIQILNSACDELRSSEKLRKLMAIILTVVNQINTGGEGKMAMGFTLDALLKLNEAKAFDKKTSVLHYVVKLVKKNDDSLLEFDSDVKSVVQAESVLLDGLINDIKSVSEELEQIHETIKQEADRLEQAGELKPMSLAELTEQKTAVRVTDGVPQFNKMDHLTGRTPMERFSLNAKVACEQASVSIERIKTKYRALLQYFGEDEQMATSDFFGTLRRFMAEWRKAVEQVEAIEKKEAKEKKRAAAKAAKGKKTAERGEKKATRTAGTATSEPSPPLDTHHQKENEGTSSSMAVLAAAAAASRARSETKGLVASTPENVATVELATSHSTINISVERNVSVPGPIPSTVAGDVAERTDEYGSSDPSSHDSFAVKAAAYRRKKERKDDGDESKPGFLSAAMAYRRKKSQRDLGSGIAERNSFEDSDDNKATAVSESSSTSRSPGEAVEGHNNALDETTPLPQESTEPSGVLSTNYCLRETLETPSVDQDNGSNGDEHDVTTESEEVTIPPQPACSPSSHNLPPKQNGVADCTTSDDLGGSGGVPNPALDNDVPNSVDTNLATNAAEIIEKQEPGAVAILPPKSESEYEMSQNGGNTNNQQKVDDSQGVKLDDEIASDVVMEKSEGEAHPKINIKGFDKSPKLVLSQLPSQSSMEVSSPSGNRSLNENEVIESSEDIIPCNTGETTTEDFPTSQHSKPNHDAQLSQTITGNIASARNTMKHPPSTESDIHDEMQAILNGDTIMKSIACTSRMIGHEIAEDGEAGELQDLSSAIYAQQQAEKAISETYSQSDKLHENASCSDMNDDVATEETTAHLSVLRGVQIQPENTTEVAARNHKVSFGSTPEQDLNTRNVMEPGSSDTFEVDDEKQSFQSAEGELSRRGPISFIYGDDGQDLDSFFDTVNLPRHVASPDVDDSSVGIMANNLQARNMASRLSESWVRGDTIQNFMGWADEAIRTSDSESVRNFEFSLDLQLNDFDDESTIATMQDDASVVSWSTPIKSTAMPKFDVFSDALDSNTPFEISEVHTVTPAQVAASILFTDSPVSQDPRPDAPSTFARSENDLLNTGLFIPNNNLSFDASRLSFAIGDVGLDDGLGFGDNGFSYGNEDDFNDLINTSIQPQSEPRSPERKSWFRWMG